MKTFVFTLITCLGLCIWSSSCWASEQESSSSDESTVQMSIEDLQTLNQLYNQQVTALSESQKALDEALTLLTESQQELTDLETALTESEQELQTLKQQVIQLKTESAKLKLELSQLKMESAKLNTKLQQAEKSLNDTQKAYEKQKKQQQRKTVAWQIVAVILGGVAIGR